MLRIWGRANSVNVKKALWCLEELVLPYERVDAGMQYGVVNTPEYRRMNPNGLVPTLEEDGFVRRAGDDRRESTHLASRSESQDQLSDRR